MFSPSATAEFLPKDEASVAFSTHLTELVTAFRVEWETADAVAKLGSHRQCPLHE